MESAHLSRIDLLIFLQPDNKRRMLAAFATETTRERLFASTRWTMVLEAGESQTPPDQALSALSELCRIYWRPIYSSDARAQTQTMRKI
jgi:hypothetical protein